MTQDIMHAVKKSPFAPQKERGRPRLVELSAEQARRFQQLYLLANTNRKSGSASMAWRVLCQEFPEIGWEIGERASKHTLPAVAVELARQAKALVTMHRGGEKEARLKGAYVPGGLRKSCDGTERIYAGERISIDDGTINIPVVIPWNLGGCKLSEKYGVKLGRFQLLQPHDEGTSFAPGFEYIIRESGGYRGTDAYGTAMRLCRDVCKPESFVFEGGVFQSPRMLRVLEALGVKLLDVKGRPNQKMIENFFNRMWTRLAMCKGLASVGRFRGEEKEVSDFYVKCRAGNADPRGKFPWLAELLEGLEVTLRFLNADRVEGKYGKWVPEERWAADMAERPRPPAENVKLWLASPVCERRKVRRQMVHVKAVGPMGLKMDYAFTGSCLAEWEGRDVEVYFDPLAEWPLQAVIAKPGTAVAIGTADCANPYHSGGIGAEAVRNVREVMRREYRTLWDGAKVLDVSKKETEVRGLDGVMKMTDFHRSEPDQLAGREKNHRAHDAAAVPEPRHTTVAVEYPSSLRSVKLRAEAARAMQPNW
jgi:hypothetical protein